MRFVLPLLLLNLFGGFLLLSYFMAARLRMDSRGVAQVTEMDRAGVINETRLAESFPKLAENTRYNLGHWMTDPAHWFILRISGISAVVVVINVVGLSAYALRLRRPRNA